MPAPQYTKEDMVKLAEMSEDTSPAAVYLPDMDYDPTKFKNLLISYGLKKDVHYLFEVDAEELPLLMNTSAANGYLQFRCTVSK